jgi:hypothetical protein
MPGTRPGMTDIVTPILTHSFLTTSEIVSAKRNELNHRIHETRRSGATISAGRSFPIRP